MNHETIQHTHALITDSQWVHRTDRHGHGYIECPACDARFYTDRHDKPRHDKGCRLVDTLCDLEAMWMAFEAKSLDEEEAADPIEQCSRMWAERMRTLESDLTTRLVAAEKRACDAERHRNEIVAAARAFGFADERLRSLLNQNG